MTAWMGGAIDRVAPGDSDWPSPSSASGSPGSSVSAAANSARAAAQSASAKRCQPVARCSIGP
jgi:hypothetical protein